MSFRLALLSVMLLPFVFGIAIVVSGITVSRTAVAQPGSEYTGTFTNTTLTQGGTTTMSMSISLPDSIKGYINFTQQSDQSPLCGAGRYQGRIIGDSVFLSFSSNDTDNSCGFDYGWLFELKARFYSDRDSIAGAYFISNPNKEQGIFNLKRAPGNVAVGAIDQEQPVIYPNPVSNRLMVKLPEHLFQATAFITDQSGHRVLVKALTTAETEINLDVPDGVYFISIVSNDLRTTQKFIVSR